MGSEVDEDLCFNGHARQHIDRLIDIVVLRFHKHVKCPAISEMLLRECYGIYLLLIATWRYVAHREKLILLFIAVR